MNNINLIPTRKRLLSFIKYVGVAIIMWVLTTITLKILLWQGLNIWLCTLFNIVFYGILKYVMYEKWEVFK